MDMILGMVIFYCIIIAGAVFAYCAWLRWVRQKNEEIRASIYKGAFIPYMEFEKNWIVAGGRGRKGVSGYKYEDGPGCYVILIFDKPVESGDWNCYSNVYIGQSVNVCARVHNHLSGKGNGDVYADVRNGKYVYVQFKRCEKHEMNDLEKSLIQAFDATSSYNKTRGGAAHR